MPWDPLFRFNGFTLSVTPLLKPMYCFNLIKMLLTLSSSVNCEIQLVIQLTWSAHLSARLIKADQLEGLFQGELWLVKECGGWLIN